MDELIFSRTKAVRCLGAAILIALLPACSGKSSVEVVSAKSPSGRVKASITETNGGATTSFGYQITIEGNSPGHEPIPVASLYGATRNAQAYGVNLVWRNETTLDIEYLTAKTAKVEHTSVQVDGQTILIRLRAGILDKTAPAGGMEYNLHK